jgi:methylisocitrate lyase
MYTQKPQQLRQLLTETGVMAPGVFNAIGAKLVQQAGFSLVYISGAGLANGVVGVPDIGLLTADEMARLAGYIARAVDVPAIADADDGYGDAWQVFRTVQQYEREGIAGLHLEDQQAPKRCGHLDGKQLVSTDVMQAKIRAAVAARQNPDTVIIARTDARAVEGIDAAIARARTYMAAGADMIFTEALTDASEFQQFRQALPGVPLMANITEFGKTPLYTRQQFTDWGYQMVIYPLTAFRQCLTTMRDVYQQLLQCGTQERLINTMTTRQQLYDLLGYADYTLTGTQWANGQIN